MGRTEAHLAEVLRAAQAGHLLPPEAQLQQQESRPWPVVLMTALGAWLAAVPLLMAIGMLLGDLALRGAGPYFVGLLLLAGGVVVLRSQGVGVFVEQLALQALLAGGGTLAYGLGRDLPPRGAAAVLCAIALGLALAIPRAWLRVLLGALAASLATLVLAPERVLVAGHPAALWLPLHALVALGLAAWLLQERVLAYGSQAAWAARLEPIAAGWMLSTLASLAIASGMTMLVGGVLGPLGGAAGSEWAGRAQPVFDGLTRIGSAALALVAAGMLARAWPALRQPLVLPVALVLAALAGFLGLLGATLLVLAAAAMTRRWRIAGAAALACAWIVGSFYYQLQWPLATKAAVLAGAGAALAALAWLAQDRHAQPGARRRGFDATPAAWIGISALASLLFANYAIWQKETLIAQGEKVYVALAPRDPRSLVQGDFMRLDFRVPDAGSAADSLRGRRPFVVARRDTRGVAELVRIGRAGEPLAPGEVRIELTPKEGRWTLVSDAWFFREGEARRWQAARFAEFRVDASGRALLVGLADQDLRPIASTP